MSEACLILTTTPDLALAQRIADHLVNGRLVACAQIDGPITSVYRWQEALQCDQEFRLLLKSHARHIPSIEAEIRRLHSYECPQFVVLEVKQLSDDYSTWLLQQVAGS